MAKIADERPAKDLDRHLQDDGKGERLNAVIDLHAKRALERLAACCGVTQRAILELLIVDAERSVAARLDALPGNQAADYYEKRIHIDREWLRSNTSTLKSK